MGDWELSTVCACAEWVGLNDLFRKEQKYDDSLYTCIYCTSVFFKKMVKISNNLGSEVGIRGFYPSCHGTQSQ